MARIYYINYIDPKTGFLKRMESRDHRILELTIRDLKKQGVEHITEGSFEES